MSSPWKVGNDPTDITPPATLPATSGEDVSVTEDVPYTWDFSSKDEGIETDDTNDWYHDSRYELIVNGVTVPYDPDQQYYTVTLTSGGGLLTFDKENGTIDWTPNNEDSIASAADDYNLTVIHYDGHNSDAQYHFNVTVTNTPPDFFAGTTDPKVLVEDSTDSGDYEINIETDDEYEGGVDYEVWFQVSASQPDGDDGGWISVGSAYTPNAEIDGNGVITYDVDSGIITWRTTNADVNYYTDDLVNPIDANHRYWFMVVATDTLGGATDDVTDPILDPPAIFEVKVQNARTEVTEVEYTDGNGDVQTEVIPVDHDPATPIVLTPSELEDVAFYLNFNALDEEHESGAFSQDTYYEIRVTGPGGVTNFFTRSDNDGWTAHPVDGDLAAGGEMTYNQDTGRIEWLPNNRDVGTWYFEVTHYDDRGTSDVAKVEVNVVDAPPSLTNPDEWTFQEYPTSPPDLSDPNDDQILDPVQDIDWFIADGDIVSDDENLGLTYELQVDVGSGWIDVDVDPSTVPELAAYDPAIWVAAQPNGTDGGWLLLNTLTGRIEWQTTNADVTHDVTGMTALKVDPDDPSSADRGPYEFRIRALDQWGEYNTPSDYAGEDGWQQIIVKVNNRNTGIHPSTIDDATPVVEDTPRSFNIGAFDEEVEKGTTVVTEYTLKVLVDLDGSGPDPAEYIDYTAYNAEILDPTSLYYGRGAVTFVTEGANAGDFSWTPNDLDAVAGQLDFMVYHDDGNQSVVSDDFTLLVTNTPPDFFAGTTDAKVLVEDSTDSGDYEINIETDDEYEGGVDYEVWFQVSASQPDGDDGGWISVGSAYTPNAEIDGNGVITYDVDSGIITWRTTNADVNYYTDDLVNPIDANHRYWFMVVATDTLGGATDDVTDPILDPPAIFEVKVQNARTEVTEVEYTDGNGDVQTEVIPVDHDPATPIVLTPSELEDVAFYLNFNALDEEHESGAFSQDTYYEIRVTGPGGVTNFFTRSDNDGWTAHPVDGDLAAGGEMTYNQDTGRIEWLPNNRDVGTWYFEVTHYDDRGTSDVAKVEVNVVDAPPSLTNPDEWTFQEYPTSPPDLSDPNDDQILDPVQDIDWFIADGDIVSDDENLGLTYELQVDVGSGWIDVDVDPSTVPELAAYDPAIWVAAQPNGTDGGWLLLNTLTGRIEWQTTNADVTHDVTGTTALKVDPDDPSSADRGPYEFRIRALDQWGEYNTPSDYAGEDGWQQIIVKVNNRNTGIHPSTIDDATPVVEDTPRSFNIGAFDEEVEKGTTVVTEYTLKVLVDLDGSGPDPAEYIDYTAYNAEILDPTSLYYGRGAVTFVTEGANAGDFSWTPNDLDAVAGQLDFMVYHDDGNQSVVSDDFTLLVTNTPPDFFAGTTDAKVLVEDSTDSGDYEINIETDDEYEGGVDYEVWFQVSASQPDGDDGGWISVGSAYTPNAEIDGNGVITYDVDSGIITWRTTNADVNYYTDDLVNPIDANHRYWFMVVATDTEGGATDDVTDPILDPPAIFEVKVQNARTEVTEVEYTDGNGDVQTEVIPVDHDPATPIVLTPSELEDVAFYLNFNALDEEHESGAFSQDTYYEIRVTGPGGVTNFFTRSDNDGWTAHPVDGDLAAGGEMTYNQDTGRIEWLPNNRDVGTWYFEVTHYDDRGTSDVAKGGGECG